MLLPFKSGRRSKISASSAVATVAFGMPLLRPPTSRIGEPGYCVRHQSRASTRVLNVTGSMSGPVTSKRCSRMRRRVRMVTGTNSCTSRRRRCCSSSSNWIAATFSAAWGSAASTVPHTWPVLRMRTMRQRRFIRLASLAGVSLDLGRRGGMPRKYGYGLNKIQSDAPPLRSGSGTPRTEVIGRRRHRLTGAIELGSRHGLPGAVLQQPRLRFVSSGRTIQCDIRVGRVIEERMSRVTPPRMNSRSRECP